MDEARFTLAWPVWPFELCSLKGSMISTHNQTLLNGTKGKPIRTHKIYIIDIALYNTVHKP